MLSRIIYSFLFLVLFTKISAQEIKKQNPIEVIKEKSAKSLIDNGQSLLFNGYEFENYPPNYFENGHIFYEDKSWTLGNLTYDGIEYKQVPLLYNLLKDELIVKNQNGFAINLLKERIRDFTIYDTYFIQLTSSDIIGSKLTPGFYQILYHQGIGIIAKKIKEIIETTTPTGTLRNIDEISNYYVKKDGNYYSFNSKKSLLKILKDYKKEIVIYLKRNKLSYKDKPEEVMVLIAKFYNDKKNL